MLIKNAAVFTGDGFEEKDIFIEAEHFADATSEHTILDGQDCYLIPGLMDIHFHGCAGFDFCDGTAEALNQMAAYELKNGVTSICPASMTLSEDALTTILKNAADYQIDWQPEKTARLCGVNLEGPFISMKKKGAQNPEFIHEPDVAMFNRLQAAANNLIKLVTLAPELDGAMEFITALATDVRISLGHMDADYQTAMTAFEKGASHITHLFNAMPGFTHREPGPIGAAFDSKAMVEIICDGIHISPAVIRAAYALFGDDQVILISDSMMATGMEDGTYALGGQPVNVRGNLATLADGTLAGSATNLMKCMTTAVSMGIPLVSAVKSATMNPARAIGEDRYYGSIDVGKYADCLLLDKDSLAIKKIILHGQVLSML